MYAQKFGKNWVKKRENCSFLCIVNKSLCLHVLESWDGKYIICFNYLLKIIQEFCRLKTKNEIVTSIR